MNIVLISTYELGRQPFGVAQLAGWLENADNEPAIVTTLIDASIQKSWHTNHAIQQADVIAFCVPMHTATRLAVSWLSLVQQTNPTARIAFYGLYAPMNEAYLRGLGVDGIFGGEAERVFVDWVLSGQEDKGTRGQGEGESIVLERLGFVVPKREGLPALSNYAQLQMPDGSEKLVGYTEASRGCKHKCRHCPIVPIYQGRFFVVQADIVLADIAQQVDMGATHITFGDPDFFNGIGHAVRVISTLHDNFPALTYDVTIKVEHLLKYAEFLPLLRDTGCLFVTCAVESFDDKVLEIFDKGHTFADFEKVVALCQEIGLTLNPTFVTFTPWTTLQGYFELLQQVARLGLVAHVTPIQYAIRLLVPQGSWLVREGGENGRFASGIFHTYDPQSLSYTWQHSDPRMDDLHRTILEIVKNGTRQHKSRSTIFSQIYTATTDIIGDSFPSSPHPPLLHSSTPVPQLSEPWY